MKDPGRQSPEFKAEKLEVAKKKAISKGGLCLSTEYIDSDAKLKWRCGNSHEWTSSFYSVVKLDTWCSDPFCKGKKISGALLKYKIENLQEYAAARGGKCLTASYLGWEKDHIWMCSEGHRQWPATWNNIKSGKWCPQCAGRPVITLDDFKEDAAGVNLEVIATTYFSNNVPHPVRCLACKHKYSVRPASVRHKRSGCPKCSGHIITIEDARKLAEKNNGQLLSSTLNNAIDHLDWQCSDTHLFSLSYNKVQQGRWCPTCSESLGEAITRSFFENVFGAPFPKKRPEWLTLNGSRLELDGYNEELSIAFEHHGLQHYEPSKFYKTPLAVQQERDAAKRKLCESRRVMLIEVPSIPDITPLDSLSKIVLRLLGEGRYSLTVEQASRVKGFRAEEFSKPSKLKEVSDLVASKGGRLLSTSYVNETTKVKVQCHVLHNPWLVTPSKLKDGSWCPRCVGKMTKEEAYAELKEMIEGGGGTLLDTSYLGANKGHLADCGKGHTWSPSPSNLRKGHWCRHCGRDGLRKK